MQKFVRACVRAHALARMSSHTHTHTHTNIHTHTHTHTQTHMHTLSLICSVIVYFIKCITSPYTLYIVLPCLCQSITQVTSLSSLCYYLSWMQYMFDCSEYLIITSPCLTHIITPFTL
jgi:hypothetical protein